MLQQVCQRLNTQLNPDSLPMQAVHGDAYLLNVLNTTSGVL